jgi:hypothetical protein
LIEWAEFQPEIQLSHAPKTGFVDQKGG